MSAQVLLNFHGLGPPHDQVEPAERPYWIGKEFFDAILNLADDNPQVPVAFTFDDGNATDLAIAAPRLKQAGRTASFFVLTSRIGRTHYLSRADLAVLRRQGMRIGLHGADHLDWRRISPERLYQETVAARSYLAEIIGTPVTEVAIPFGAYNPRIIRLLKELHYSRIYTSDGGWTDTRARVASRWSIRNDMSLSDVAKLLVREEPFRVRLRRRLSTTKRRYIA